MSEELEGTGRCLHSCTVKICKLHFNCKRQKHTTFLANFFMEPQPCFSDLWLGERKHILLFLPLVHHPNFKIFSFLVFSLSFPTSPQTCDVHMWISWLAWKNGNHLRNFLSLISDKQTTFLRYYVSSFFKIVKTS